MDKIKQLMFIPVSLIVIGILIYQPVLITRCYMKTISGKPVLAQTGGGKVYDRLGKTLAISTDFIGGYIPSISGNSLYLTIDKNIQAIVERELQKAVRNTKSKQGMVLAVNPQNGEILAVAVRRQKVLEREDSLETQCSQIFGETFEPGGIFDIFTSAAAFDEGRVNPGTSIFDPGYIIVEDRRIKCYKMGGHGKQTVRQALENSCNTVFAQLSMGLGKDIFCKYLKAFGFSAKTGIDFPGESHGKMKSLTEITNVELATMGIGQGILVTPLQIVMGMSAITNGGNLVKPHILKEIHFQDGKRPKIFKRTVIRRVITVKTADLATSLLQSTMLHGIGKKSKRNNSRIAGITGIAQKFIPGRKVSSGVTTSFIGFVPADYPQVVVLVMFDEPQCPDSVGGEFAARVGEKILQDTLLYLGVKPQ